MHLAAELLPHPLGELTTLPRRWARPLAGLNGGKRKECRNIKEGNEKKVEKSRKGRRKVRGEGVDV